MFIKKLQIKNLKCFKDKTFENLAVPNGKKGSGLNILIGENNTGKTTFISVFTKLKDGAMIYDEEKYNGNDVEIVINDTEGKDRIIKNIAGSSNVDLQNKGDSGLNDNDIDIIKDNRIWTSNFSGEIPFSSYKTTLDFKRSSIDGNLSGALSFLEKNNKEKKEKFNKLLSKITPAFSNWTIKSSSKYGSYISYKLSNGQSLDIDFSLGSGILNLFRIILSFVEDKKIIFIDEPEAFLHPKAQEKLLKLFLEEAKNRQIFISTHSPYMFKGAIGEGAKLSIFKKSDAGIEIIDARDNGWGIFGRFSPTWGEINWNAYDLPMVEFHNELYGYLEANYKSKLSGLKKNKKWLDDRKLKGGETREKKEKLKNDVSLQEYIRHSIHHPENIENDKYSDEELRKSTQEMIDLIKNKP